MYSPSHSSRDGDKGVCLPTLILYGDNSWATFDVFVCEGLVGESIMTICEFNELKYEFGGRCYGCLYLIWGPNYA